MIDQMIVRSGQLLKKRQQDPEQSERMKHASEGQSPQYLLISPIDRTQQDMQLLSFQQGDAFHATRVSLIALPSAKESLFLFGGPAAYTQHIHNRSAVIMTFESDEASDVIRTSIEHAARHPALVGLPIVALRVDYEQGQARLIPHGMGRSYETENKLISKLKTPDELDSNTLVITCSDSRMMFPPTPRGLAMSIHTLGGYIPPFSEDNTETVALNGYLKTWLSSDKAKTIVVIVHGDFGGGQACGACIASMQTEAHGEILGQVIDAIREAVSVHETVPPTTPQNRALSVGRATTKNLLEYPAIRSGIKEKRVSKDLVQMLLSDTVTNVLSPPP